MIGRLKGIVAGKSAEGVLVDVGGVGYDLFVPLSTLATLPALGQAVVLSVHTHVREDELRLFGFESDRDRSAFRTMLKVSGVGPKLALAVLGALSGDDLSRAVGEGDVKRLSAIPGIGKKTAERMILELSGKLVQESGEASVPGPAGGVFAQLGVALVNLGFKPVQVDRVLGELRKESQDDGFEVLLRRALGRLKE
ncbi:MAG: Holliday junction branch migration protein RuvA [Myxococcota bacterium]|nr:Holliday junction branch migration protein RuvA [Myxococcota bacterium]